MRPFYKTSEWSLQLDHLKNSPNKIWKLMINFDYIRTETCRRVSRNNWRRNFTSQIQIQNGVLLLKNLFGLFEIWQELLKLTPQYRSLGIRCEIDVRLKARNLTNDKLILVQAMAWCRQAASHYLSQCWPRSVSPYGVTMPRWVKFSFYFKDGRTQVLKSTGIFTLVSDPILQPTEQMNHIWSTHKIMKYKF